MCACGHSAASFLATVNATLALLLSGLRRPTYFVGQPTLPAILLQDDALFHPSFDALLGAALLTRPSRASILLLGGCGKESAANKTWQPGYAIGEQAILFWPEGARLWQRVFGAPSWRFNEGFCNAAPDWKHTNHGMKCYAAKGTCFTPHKSFKRCPNQDVVCNGTSRTCQLFSYPDLFWMQATASHRILKDQVVHYTRHGIAEETADWRSGVNSSVNCGLVWQQRLNSASDMQGNGLRDTLARLNAHTQRANERVRRISSPFLRSLNT